MRSILWITQPSMRSYKTKKYLLLSDGPMIRTRNIIKELLKHEKYKIYLVVPQKEQIEDLKEYKELFSDFKIKLSLIEFIPIWYPYTVQLSRFNFDLKTIENMLGKIINNVDLIINEISELTLNYKVWLKVYNHKNVPIISYTGHFSRLSENKEYNIDFYLRQIDGYLASDKFVINKKSNLNTFKKTINHLYKNELINTCKNKFYLWDYGISTEELDGYKTKEKFGKLTIFFISRLSDNLRTKGKLFIDYINDLYQKNNTFQVIFANVNDAMDWDYLKRNVKPIYIYKQGGLTRKEYIELLYKSDIVPILYNTDEIFSLGEYEAYYTGNIIIHKLDELEKIINYRDFKRKNYEINEKSVEYNISDFVEDINLCF